MICYSLRYEIVYAVMKADEPGKGLFAFFFMQTILPSTKTIKRKRASIFMKKTNLLRLLITAVLLAVGMVLPLLLGQVQVLGQTISPLHIPVLICGLTCGAPYGVVLGFVLPLLRSLIFGMPPLVPVAVPMAFEMAVYGLLTGLLYPVFRRLFGNKMENLLAILAAMLIAMVAGRLVGGAAKAIVMGLQSKAYTFDAFVAGYFVTTSVGAVIHLIVCPAVVVALEKAKLSPMGK